MPRTDTFTLLRNLDHRVSTIEQILPTLATREDVHEIVHEAVQRATAPLATREEIRALATREEMHAAIKVATAPLATREEMHAAIKAATAPLATRNELLATRDELCAALRAEGDETRRHFDVVAESIRMDVRVIAERHTYLSERLGTLESGVTRDKARVDERLLRLEARTKR
jgi:hypothetical protein